MVATFKKKFGSTPPDLAIVLGSGLGAFINQVKQSKKISYKDIPDFPKTSVAGHAGECVVGEIGERRALIFCGRFHYYEGHSLPIVTLPIRAAGAWGAKTLVVTNAAGSLRDDLPPGALMLISDHMNLMGANPLRGPNLGEMGPRFFDMTNAYDPKLREQAKNAAKKCGIPLQEGVYAAVSGPSYETPAEIQMLSRIGADAVGMSTVPEVIVARHQGMRVLGISCMTNWAAGIKPDAPSLRHEEVIEQTKRVESSFGRLLMEWIQTYDLR